MPSSKSKPGPQSVSIILEPISVDIKGAANFIGTSVRQMRTLVYSGEIQPIPLGKKHLFLVDDLRAFVKTRRAAA
jgi:hypothetical protein